MTVSISRESSTFGPSIHHTESLVTMEKIQPERFETCYKKSVKTAKNRFMRIVLKRVLDLLSLRDLIGYSVTACVIQSFYIGNSKHE